MSVTVTMRVAVVIKVFLVVAANDSPDHTDYNQNALLMYLLLISPNFTIRVHVTTSYKRYGE